LPASARQPLFADVRAALNRGVAGLRSALHGLSLEVARAEPSQGKLPAMDYLFDRLVIANQLIRDQQTTIIFGHLGFSLMSRWQARIGGLD
jgi:hypothetical protein